MTQEKIALIDFEVLNRRGFPCSKAWKYKLIRDGKFPYPTIVDNTTTYVIITSKKDK